MLLLREQIVELMRADDLQSRLVIMPLLSDEQIGPGTVDLRLGTEFIEAQRRTVPVIDPYNRQLLADIGNEPTAFVPLGRHLILHPGQFILGATLEFVRLPAHVGAQVLSRSSWGRLGLLVATAVVVQPGFAGCLTLELVNTGTVPIMLRPGLRIAQLQLWSADRPTQHVYATGLEKYKSPLGPQSHRLVVEIEELARLERIGNQLLGPGAK